MRSEWHMDNESPIILALDFADIARTKEMIERTSSSISIFKLGLEFFLAQGKDGVANIQNEFPDIDIFLDLKLHDIPNTVSGAAMSVAPLAPRFLTVHASGGSSMIKAATQALPETLVTAVTVLTSLDSDELQAMGFPGDAQTLAVNLASWAVVAGARAIVCSPHEVGALRSQLDSTITLITPGVRLAHSSLDDQKRVMTPSEAIAAGANYVVIGRPITQAQDPASAAREISSSLS